jgi:hypothetical protein
MTIPYRALALQFTCHEVNQVNSTEARLIIQNTILTDNCLLITVY